MFGRQVRVWDERKGCPSGEQHFGYMGVSPLGNEIPVRKNEAGGSLCSSSSLFPYSPSQPAASRQQQGVIVKGTDSGAPLSKLAGHPLWATVSSLSSVEGIQ